MPDKLGRIDYAFFALMLATGVGVAAYVARNPALADASSPPIIWPIAVSFAFDLATLAMQGGGRPPLAMPIRAVGVIGAMLLYTLLVGVI
jgi:hypothetical protein